MQPDEQLVGRCRDGEARAWERLVRRHQDRILNLAYQFTGNREESRDLAQEIFVHLYRKLDQYDSRRPFRTWFNSLARNLCIDHYRRRRQAPPVVGTPVEEIIGLRSSIESPARRVERRDRRETLMRAMDSLGEVSREAIVLKELQGHNLDEIAAMLGVPIGTVKSRLFRARIELGRAILKLRQAVSIPEGDLGL
ncbi:MAG: sigma-70 family RNA polymerase sigma factor [Candidatus Eisenbacteria sp.]|nr:sigma-70 family RNA polymerase sigma factor [Candidatus Eisenbacteria bacterium]